jgi:peptidoglycan hydrolase CwlO-like protein
MEGLLLNQQTQSLELHESVLNIKTDIAQLKIELDNRLKKICEKCATIMDLHIELKEKDIVILKLKKEIHELHYKYCPKHLSNNNI